MSNLLDSLDHITIITKDLDETKNFYINILGMKIDNNRPPFDFDGAWLALNNRPVVHIIVNDIHAHSSAKPTLDHVAFRANNIESIKKRLGKYNIAYEERITPDNQVHQIFTIDPNGIKIELSKLI
jgi:catechol 2,3-dioxygenase-like lactoylglutathione lyase family enzyme